MLRVVEPPLLAELNRNADDASSRNSDAPAWRYHLQSRGFLFPLERVCGTEREVNAMRVTSTSNAGHIRSALAMLSVFMTAASLINLE